jgi:hypothetical protein
MGSLLGRGGGPVERGMGALPSLPWWGGGAHAPGPLSPASLERGYKVHMLCPRDQGRPWDLLHVVDGPWTSWVC